MAPAEIHAFFPSSISQITHVITDKSERNDVTTRLRPYNNDKFYASSSETNYVQIRYIMMSFLPMAEQEILAPKNSTVFVKIVIVVPKRTMTKNYNISSTDLKMTNGDNFEVDSSTLNDKLALGLQNMLHVLCGIV